MKHTYKQPSGGTGKVAMNCRAHMPLGSGAIETAEPQFVGPLRRRAVSEYQRAAVPPIVGEVLRSPGQSLDPETRAFFEPRFGRDFSDVRVHTDTAAVKSALAVGAIAYTVGRDVVFGEGGYAPATTEGRRLLTHELVHTLQQEGSDFSFDGGATGISAVNSAATG